MTQSPHETTGRKKVAMVTLGCPKNRVDSEIMLGRLQAEGYSLVEDPAAAQTVIVNTCGFVEEAQQESIDTILELASRKGNGLERLLVAGCMVNRFGEELKAEIPEIDDFVSLDELDLTANLVSLGRGGALPTAGASVRTFDHAFPRVLTTHGYSYMKVAEGVTTRARSAPFRSGAGAFGVGVWAASSKRHAVSMRQGFRNSA